VLKYIKRSNLHGISFTFIQHVHVEKVGDCFSTHTIPNPDLESEIELLRSYATNIDDATLHKVVRSFGELRYLSEKGDISYPYSTREAGESVWCSPVHFYISGVCCICVCAYYMHSFLLKSLL
jgi:hypothetical protein